MRKIYLASSWRNPDQPACLHELRQEHTVYDFRHPKLGDQGFHWSDIDEAWQEWSPLEFIESLEHEVAERGFKNDFDAMHEADTCVLLLPCGKSAHLEAGWFVGAGKELHILLEGSEKAAPVEPELMYKMATGLHENVLDLMDALRK